MAINFHCRQPFEGTLVVEFYMPVAGLAWMSGVHAAHERFDHFESLSLYFIVVTLVTVGGISGRNHRVMSALLL